MNGNRGYDPIENSIDRLLTPLGFREGEDFFQDG